jgi:hypothetical protein
MPIKLCEKMTMVQNNGVDSVHIPVNHFFYRTSSPKLIHNGGPNSWPPRFPDRTKRYFFFSVVTCRALCTFQHCHTLCLSFLGVYKLLRLQILSPCLPMCGLNLNADMIRAGLFALLCFVKLCIVMCRSGKNYCISYLNMFTFRDSLNNEKLSFFVFIY